MSTPKENFEATVNFQEPERPLFVIWNTAPFGTSLLGVKQKDFYFDAELKLKAQMTIQEKFPEALLVPGPWPDFGVAVEPSAFGCKIEWPDNEPPWARPAIESITEVRYMRKPIPGKDGITGLMLEQYRYMWDHLDKKYIDEYGFLEGLGYILGPLETAALVVGYGQILFELYDHPKEVHKLLQIITEFEIEWLHEQEKINGKLKRLYVPEHFPTQVSPDHFEEFCFPYISQIFNEFPYAIGLYHNEGNVSHIMERIPDMGAKIFHFGNNIDLRKQLGVNITPSCFQHHFLFRIINLLD
ncbi:uroporphyrinogen decarboxylase family protein [Neomoorella mulderi]|uniref:Methylcobalamin:coenzyme M methyltransferase n=1 Tax=Moorella mulderi DSM 14980 TaxID=1122241 RepID=A0A151AZM5_9FIRM|nr:uroporphyrinogen decarboxylase family protein [Moorella mulderi]KYH33109.1 methylcobalamin:coenzyme M methyltransferase [Moorella mulderi DSM 14980]